MPAIQPGEKWRVLQPVRHYAHGAKIEEAILGRGNHLHGPSVRHLSLRVVRPRDVEPAHLVLKRSAFQTEAFCRAARAGKFA